MNEKGAKPEFISLNLKDAVELGILHNKQTAENYFYCSDCV
jgi:hypothetical protein